MGDELAAYGGRRAREIIRWRKKDRRVTGSRTSVAGLVRVRRTSTGKREWKEQDERVETHILPTPTTSTTSWLHSCLYGGELYVESTWTFERKKDSCIHSFPRIFRVRDFPFFHVDARCTYTFTRKKGQLNICTSSLIDYSVLVRSQCDFCTYISDAVLI